MTADLNIQQLLEYLLPLGTRGTAGDFDAVPLWPFDLFGVVAYLVQQSDCHTRLLEHHTNGIGSQFAVIKDQLVNAGMAWRYVSDIDSPRFRSKIPEVNLIQDYWTILLSHGDCSIAECRKNDEIVITLLALIAISDEACVSAGYYAEDTTSAVKTGEPSLWIPAVFDYVTNGVQQSKLWPDSGDWYVRFKPDPQLPFENEQPLPTGCFLIPADRLCVLPKSYTPALGCTLRSLTHNLALHPSATQIKSSWYNYQRFGRFVPKRSLNILIVPIPYEISPNDFIGHVLNDPAYRGFTIQQSWLAKCPADYAKEIAQLIEQCEREKALPDIIVFPEAALNRDYHQAILEEFARDKRLPQLIVIAGISDALDSHHHHNYSSTAYLSGGVIELTTGQSKHHRWKLEKNQIRDYGLASSLSPEEIWWELAKLDDRTVKYHVFGEGTTVGTLLCEDLARVDPCKPSINASAPNLLFALLMDGPQIASRWPARYAIVLADDPGCAVLTVTSTGLIERSNWRYNNVRSTIALWGDADGVKELDLPPNKRALLLTIESKKENRVSLDGRVSTDKAVGWSYKGHRAL